MHKAPNNPRVPSLSIGVKGYPVMSTRVPCLDEHEGGVQFPSSAHHSGFSSPVRYRACYQWVRKRWRMAEVVHRNLESMLPELEELERSGIFTHEEVRMIVKRRRNLEYRLLRRPAKKQDFLRAIQYEVNLDLLRRHRKKKLGIVSTRNDAEYGIQNRIHSLFQRALKKFKADLKLWLQYIEFSKRSHQRLSLSRTFGKALALHPNKPGLWVMAAKFEFEDLKDVSSARVLLQQGLRANPTSKHLWTEYFRMELMHTDKIRKRRSVLGLDKEEDEAAAAASDDFLAYKTASIVYRQATKAIPDDIDFRLSFLPIYRLFEDTHTRQQEVYDSIREDFSSHPLCWDVLARRPWLGVDRTSLTGAEITELEARTEELFHQGLETMKDGTVLLLWEKYIRWCEERVQQSSQSDLLQKKAVQRLLVAFKQAASECSLSETLFEQYVRTLQGLGQTKEASVAAAQATEVHPHSVSTWLLRLRTHTTTGRENDDHVALCREALEQVPKESSLPLWQHWIEYSITTQSSSKDIEAIFQAAIDSGFPAVCEALSLQYLDWTVMVGGVKKARRVYQRLLKVQPVQYSLYEKCIALEKSTEKPSMGRMRELFEQAVRDYGLHYPGLWLQYIRTEMEMSEGKVENIGRLHWRAVNTLQPQLAAEFISHHSLLQTVK